ncbi:hypothetical protein CXF68_08520 [Tenacibaculum sp. Bg11-29]|uniref:hypothetical protein n=1 Tax=Tenacibaculum sp. Bg11-29 TaxID=2058306 RepID=UPI000C34F172|nr:hypothetical protein [Tenacibaculum sp. Bg11-29]PKH50731.1 hypothetical protein CXF68_08520 [Tenacibaculum sp. Bg11-29]
MLKIGGILNIIIAIAHIIGLFWAEQMFEKTGTEEGMQKLTEINHTLPYLLTVFVAIIFSVFGLYGVLADSKIRKLPFLKFGIFTIAFIYLFRAIGEQSYNILKGTTTKPETIQSIIALIIGLLFLFGGYTKWKLNKQ